MKYTNTKEYKLVKLNGLKFRNEKGQIVEFLDDCYGFCKDNKFIAKLCKSYGGSSLPLAYHLKLAKHIVSEGFVEEEIYLCEAVSK